MKNRGKLQICIYIHELMVSVIVPSCTGKETEELEKWAVSMWSYWFCQHSLGFRLHGMLTDLRTIIVSKRSFCLFNVCPAIRRFNPIKHHSENFITVQENLLRSILIKHLNAIILWKICLFHQPLWLFNNPRTALGTYRCHFVDFRFSQLEVVNFLVVCQRVVLNPEMLQKMFRITKHPSSSWFKHLSNTY